MTFDEHRARHEALHGALDELAADFLSQNPDKLPSTTTLLELMQWSHSQTLDPVERFDVAGHLWLRRAGSKDPVQ